MRLPGELSELTDLERDRSEPKYKELNSAEHGYRNKDQREESVHRGRV